MSERIYTTVRENAPGRLVGTFADDFDEAYAAGRNECLDVLERKGVLDAPLIGPAHAPVVLDGVTVEELKEAYCEAFNREQSLLAGVRGVLSAVNIAIPEGHGTVEEVLEWNLEVVPDGDFVVREGRRVAFLAKKEE